MSMSKYAKQLKKELEEGRYPLGKNYLSSDYDHYRVDSAIDLIFRTISSMLDRRDPLSLKEIAERLAPALVAQAGYPPYEELKICVSKETENIGRKYDIKKTRLKDCLREIYSLSNEEKIKITGSRQGIVILFKSKKKLLNKIRRGTSLERIINVKARL